MTSSREILASIDIGAHSARLLIAEVLPDGMRYRTLEELEMPVPLGSDVFRTGSISDESLRATCAILRNFKQKMEEYSIRKYCAIATSAVREAANAAVFLERAAFLTGLQIRIFSGADEARLAHLAVQSLLPGEFPFKKQKILLADIGTGAIQVSVYDHGKLCFTETVRLGTLRASAFMETASPEMRRESSLPSIERAFQDMTSLSGHLECDTLILTGSSVRAMILLRDRPLSKRQVHELSVTEFEVICKKALAMTVENLCDKFNLRPDVAEVILPCCLIADTLRELTGAGTIQVPMISTKNALIENFILENCGGRDPFEKQILELAEHTAFRYGCSAELIHRTAEFSEKLFTKLKPLHGLGARELLLLKVAALLHRTGLFIDNSAYHKHGCYIIQNTEIPGLSAEERRIVALLVRYHRKSFPKEQHPEFACLSISEKSLVTRLAAILRIACGLALSRSGGMRINVSMDPGCVTVRIPGSSSIRTWNAVDTTLFHYAFAVKMVFVHEGT